jgi:hypothetical protein
MRSRSEKITAFLKDLELLRVDSATLSQLQGQPSEVYADLMDGARKIRRVRNHIAFMRDMRKV